MINVWFCDCSKMNIEQFNIFIQSIPFKIQDEIGLNKFFKDKVLSLVSKLLLRKAIINTGYSPILFERIKRLHNKPYIKDWMPFNISHSKDIVTLAFGENNDIGIDIEAINHEISVTQLLDYFLPADKELILNSKDENLFFDMWVRKEAVLKAKGYGILNGLNVIDCSKDIVYDDDDKKWFLNELSINHNYICYLAINTSNQKIKLQEMFINDL